jgi:redox-sensitive bicupin YhaK (pirin superfamily)
MAQLWVNLPRANKFAPPRYQPIGADQIGVATLPDGAGTVRVIAGEYQGVHGPAKTFTPIHLFDAKLSASGKFELSLPASHNVAVLVMEGEVVVNAPRRAANAGTRAGANDFVVFENEGSRIDIEAQSDARLLVLGGEPIDEPVVQYGPFVMNSAAEIADAITDFNEGKFGTLED